MDADQLEFERDMDIFVDILLDKVSQGKLSADDAIDMFDFKERD